MFDPHTVLFPPHKGRERVQEIREHTQGHRARKWRTWRLCPAQFCLHGPFSSTMGETLHKVPLPVGQVFRVKKWRYFTRVPGAQTLRRGVWMSFSGPSLFRSLLPSFLPSIPSILRGSTTQLLQAVTPKPCPLPQRLVVGTQGLYDQCWPFQRLRWNISTASFPFANNDFPCGKTGELLCQ